MQIIIMIRMTRLKKALYRRIWINLLSRDICKIINIHQLTISSRHGINFYITAMCECGQQNVISSSTVIMQQKGPF